MKVKLHGFELLMGDGISLNNFADYLIEASGVFFGDQVIALVKKEDYWKGVLLTVKDAKAFCKIKRDKGHFTVTAQELEAGSSIADFNFFIVNPNTGRGLYQYYHQSSHLNDFCLFLKRRYDALKKQKILEEIGDQILDDKGRKIIQKQFKNSLRYAIIERPATLDQKIDELARIKNIELEFVSVEFGNDPLAPVTKFANRRSERVVFSKNNADLVKVAVKKLLAANPYKRLRIEGVDPEGNDKAFNAMLDYDVFAEYEYNDLIKTVTLDSTNLVASLQQCPVILNILAVADTTARLMLTGKAK